MLTCATALVVAEEEKIDDGANNVSGRSEIVRSQAGIGQSVLAQLALLKSRVHRAGTVVYLEPDLPHYSHDRNIGIPMVCLILLLQTLSSLVETVCRLQGRVIEIDEVHATEQKSLYLNRG